jgi:drug/metabolite transporter (DMT)-like permease
MIWLLLTIISATGIFLIFKLLGRFKIPILNVIVLNYLVAALLGFVIYGKINFSEIINALWFPVSFIIGFLFIANFFLIGLSSNKVGISITTVASKMSVAIPMAFSIIYYREPIQFLKVFGLVLALVAVAMAVIQKNKTKSKAFAKTLLPAVLFIGMGITDSSVKYAQQAYVPDSEASVFSAALFGIAFLFGLLSLFLKKDSIKPFRKTKTYVAGISLGIVNFGSIYFIIRCLNSGVFQSSIVFGMANISVVTLSVIIGTVFFKEKLSKLNYIGIVLAITAIVILSLTR